MSAFGIQCPCQRNVDRERERELRTRLRCVSSRMMACWTCGHCTGNENEQTGSSERGSVNTDTGLYSLSDLFERASPKFSYRINTTPPALTYLFIQTTCHLFSGGKLILSDFNSIQNTPFLLTPCISGIPLIVLDSMRVKKNLVSPFLTLFQSKLSCFIQISFLIFFITKQ